MKFVRVFLKSIPGFVAAGFAAVLFFNLWAYGDIVVCETQDCMEESVQKVLETHKGKKILVIFDVDMVLLQPCDPAVQMGSTAAHGGVLRQLFGSLSDLEKQMALTLAIVSSKAQLVSKKMPDFIDKLNRTENVYTLGLTAFTTEAFQNIPSLEHWRIEILNHFGIHLGHKDFPAEKVFLSAGEKGDINPLFFGGLIFCDDVNNSQAKPDNLQAFFDHIGWIPEVIVFIDDRDKYLQAMADMLRQEHPEVHFSGLHYKQAFVFPENPVLAREFQAKWERFVTKGKELALKKAA
ncbi:MAG: DUF2608 domain-containing protein [bacterium]|nr:DUF2608 domain-containing protein [bacterium]